MTRRARVLVVEDEPEFVDVLPEDLSEREHHIATALNGEAALAAIARARPNLVLLDLHMLGLGELLRRIRTLALAIVVTVNTAVHVARETLKGGAFDYLTRPPVLLFRADEIIESMKGGFTATLPTVHWKR